MRENERISIDDQRIRLLLDDRVECFRQILGLSRLVRQESKAETSSGFPHGLHKIPTGGILWVPQHGDPYGLRRQLME